MKVCLISIIFSLFLCLTVSAQTSGKISGKLTYPSEYIPPDMVICIESKSRTVCSNSGKVVGFTFKVNPRSATYTVTLPVGKYYIYGLTKEMRGVRAYYNEFVRCGMDVRCKSKKKILLDVKRGQAIRGITIGDWY